MKKIILGRIGDTYGIKGWSHFLSFTDPVENIFTYKNWQIEQSKEQFEPIKLESYKAHGNSFVIKLVNCNNPEQALLHRGKSIAIKRCDLPTLNNNEYYWSDLIGLTVINTQGESLGIIDHLFETGSNDVIVINSTKTRAEACIKNSTETRAEACVLLLKQHYIPYLPSVVKEINLAKKTMLVEWELI